MTAWTNLVEGHHRNIPAKLYWNRFSGFWQEDFYCFLFRYIGKISPATSSHVFLTNHDCLNNLGRGSPKLHSCQVILKSVRWFLTRRILKFSIQIYTKNKPSPPPPPPPPPAMAAMFLTYHEGVNNLGRRSPKATFLLSYIELDPTVSYEKIFKVFYTDI